MIVYLQYQNAPDDAVALEIDALDCKERDEVAYDTGRTLREIEYEHRRSKRLNQLLSIGADVLADEDNYAFMRAWWTAAARWYSLDGDTYVECRCDGGVSPVEFLEGLVELPSWTVTLIEKRPR